MIRRFVRDVAKRIAALIPDALYLRLLYRIKMGKSLNLKNPRTFTEKIQWLKLYNRRPEMTAAVDKSAVKEIVSQLIGNQYVIPTINGGGVALCFGDRL